MPRKTGVVLRCAVVAACVLALSAPALFAAADNDSELWLGFKLKAPVAKNLSVFAYPQLRYDNNWDRYYYERYDVGLSVQLSNRWRVEPLYTYLEKRGSSSWDKSDLFSTDLYFTQAFAGNFEFENRVRWEYDFGSDFQGLRERAKVSMKLPSHKSVKLFLSEEVIYDLSIEDLKESRASLGVSKKFDSGVSLDLAYQHTSRNKNGNWTDAHATVITFGYTL